MHALEPVWGLILDTKTHPFCILLISFVIFLITCSSRSGVDWSFSIYERCKNLFSFSRYDFLPLVYLFCIQKFIMNNFLLCFLLYITMPFYVQYAQRSSDLCWASSYYVGSVWKLLCVLFIVILSSALPIYSLICLSYLLIFILFHCLMI